MSKAEFPQIENSGKAIVDGGAVTFSYLNSQAQPVTETLPLLYPEEIVNRVRERMERFEQAAPGARESDESRAERKYISAHPEKTLRDVWDVMDGDTRMEFSMMLDMNSHHGISDSKWMKAHAGKNKSHTQSARYLIEGGYAETKEGKS